MTIEAFIEELRAKVKRWGRLVNDPVASNTVMEVIEHYETQLNLIEEVHSRTLMDLIEQKEKLQGELTTERRRVAACNARETGLKNKLQALKDDAEKTRTDTSD